ncbi:MAG: AraC family transcriptional regulator [Flavobacteriaceae bacterium]|nr:AraC family transcriptional regulator [Flavobacteriaceae bacterium]
MIYLILDYNSNNLPLMKSVGVIYILFLFANILCYANPKPNLDDKFEFNNVLVDSIFESQQQLIEKSKNVIEQYDVLIKNGIPLDTKDHKRLAESYAHLGDPQKATLYLEYYIKESFDTNILYSDVFKKIDYYSSFQILEKTYLPKINSWILLFIFSGVIGIFISIIINLRKKGDSLANLLIGLFVLFHSFFILHLSLYLTNYVYHVPHSFWATITFSFLYGPLLYFYFKRIAQGYTFKRKDVLHFVPTLLLLIYFIPTYFLPAEAKLNKIFNIDSSYINTLYAILFFKAISLITYSFFIYKIYTKRVKTNTKVDKQVYLWQRNIAYLNIVYALTYSVYAFIIASNVVFDRSKSVMVYSQVFVLALIVLYVAYTAYVQPRVFSKKYLFNELPIKYQKSGLTEGYSFELKEQLIKLLKEEKVFKDNSISLNSLSDRMGVTRHNLSQVINEHFALNFFNLINKYRIQEAQEILRNDLNQNLNIIDVAYDVGFNNKVTFNKAFKEATNLTPTQYIKSLRAATLRVNFK